MPALRKIDIEQISCSPCGASINVFTPRKAWAFRRSLIIISEVKARPLNNDTERETFTNLIISVGNAWLSFNSWLINSTSRYSRAGLTSLLCSFHDDEGNKNMGKKKPCYISTMTIRTQKLITITSPTHTTKKAYIYNNIFCSTLYTIQYSFVLLKKKHFFFNNRILFFNVL